MRIGFNPKRGKMVENEFFHQIVLPVYIPHEEGYFKDSFAILKICLNSLFSTCHNQTYFTIVNNGSSPKVRSYLESLYTSSQIHELIHTTNVGRVNANLKGLVGHSFKLVTLTDADVLFANGWQEATYKVFENFNSAGAVTPVPNSRMIKTLTGNVLIANLFSKKLKFTKVKDPKSMEHFANSINNFDLLKKVHLEKYLTITNNDIEAMLGAGHFVITYRDDVFQKVYKNTNYLFAGNSNDVFDIPVIENGFWRLSTASNYAFHMGNTLESWMDEKEINLKKNEEKVVMPKIEEQKINLFFNYLSIHFFSKILFKKPIWRLFLRWKGLTKAEAANY